MTRLLALRLLSATTRHDTVGDRPDATQRLLARGRPVTGGPRRREPGPAPRSAGPR